MKNWFAALTLLLAYTTSWGSANELAGPAYKSRFAGFVVEGATLAKASAETQLHAKELLALAQLTHAVVGGKADHGLCQGQVVEVLELQGGEAYVERFRSRAQQQGFKYEDIRLSRDADKQQPFSPIFALEGRGHMLLGLWSFGKTKDVPTMLTLCQTR